MRDIKGDGGVGVGGRAERGIDESERLVGEVFGYDCLLACCSFTAVVYERRAYTTWRIRAKPNTTVYSFQDTMAELKAVVEAVLAKSSIASPRAVVSAIYTCVKRFENYPILLSVKGTRSGWFLFFFRLVKIHREWGAGGRRPTQGNGRVFAYTMGWRIASPSCRLGGGCRRRDPRVDEERRRSSRSSRSSRRRSSHVTKVCRVTAVQQSARGTALSHYRAVGGSHCFGGASRQQNPQLDPHRYPSDQAQSTSSLGKTRESEGKTTCCATLDTIQPHMHAAQELCSIEGDLCNLCLTDAADSHHGSSALLVSSVSHLMPRVANTATLCGSACGLRMLTISRVYVAVLSISSAGSHRRCGEPRNRMLPHGCGELCGLCTSSTPYSRRQSNATSSRH